MEKKLGVRYKVRKAKNERGYGLVRDDYISKKSRNSIVKDLAILYGPAIEKIIEFSSTEVDLLSRLISLIRYADDFVVLCETQQNAFKVKLRLQKRLTIRDLVFNEEKTNIRQLNEVFDFLGAQ